MNVRKTVVRVGVAVTTGIALMLSSFIPVAQAYSYKGGDLDCGLSSGRRVTAYADAQSVAYASAGGIWDRKSGNVGPYRAEAKSYSVAASWFASGDPWLLAGDGGCSV